MISPTTSITSALCVKRADELYLQNLRLQQKLERYEKWYYGPRGDRLQSSAYLAQALLEFAQQLE